MTVSRKFCPSANISTNHRRAVVYVIGQKAFQHIICPQCASMKSNGLDFSYYYGSTGCPVFQVGDTKLERFLRKNQHTQRK